MGLGDFFRGIAMARDELNSLVHGVAFELADKHGWSQKRAEAFCMKDKFNRKRILHMRKVLGYSADNVAAQIHAGAVASGYDTHG